MKEGYVPQEEVPLYESKGKQFVTRQQKPQPVRLPSGLIAHPSIPGLYIKDEIEKPKTKNKKKNKSMYTKSKKKFVNCSLFAEVEDVAKDLEKVKISEPAIPKANNKTANDKAETNDQSVDPIKKLKNLKKRLREIEALEEKLSKGEIVKPDPDQLAKVKRKNDLLLQIRQLERTI